MKLGAVKRTDPCQNYTHWTLEIREQNEIKRPEKKLMKWNAKKKFWTKVKTSKAKEMTLTVMKWSQTCWIDPHWNHETLYPFMDEWRISYHEGKWNLEIRELSETEIQGRKYNDMKWNWKTRKSWNEVKPMKSNGKTESASKWAKTLWHGFQWNLEMSFHERKSKIKEWMGMRRQGR